jgi:sec-independent protein translocase protein TatA
MVLILGLIIFGPKRLPEVGEGLGKSLREFRKATSGIHDVAHRASSEVQDIARETIPPVTPPRQHAVPDIAAQRALAVEDVEPPAMDALEPSRR